MLQLIGWMGCIYLFVKGFEFLASGAYRDENGSLKGTAALAIAIAWLGSVAMFLAITLQGIAAPGMGGMETPPLTASEVDEAYPERSAAWHDCVTAAKDAVEASACKDVK